MWGSKSPILGDLGKIELLSTHSLLCLFVCQKIATFCPPSFLTHDATEYSVAVQYSY